MSVSPNPSNGVINITAETGELNRVNITVYDVQGQMMIKQLLLAAQEESLTKLLDLSEFLAL